MTGHIDIMVGPVMLHLGSGMNQSRCLNKPYGDSFLGGNESVQACAKFTKMNIVFDVNIDTNLSISSHSYVTRKGSVNTDVDSAGPK